MVSQRLKTVAAGRLTNRYRRLVASKVNETRRTVKANAGNQEGQPRVIVTFPPHQKHGNATGARTTRRSLRAGGPMVF